MKKGILLAMVISFSVFAGVAFAERAVTTTRTAAEEKAEWKIKHEARLQAVADNKPQVQERIEKKNEWMEKWNTKKDEIRANAEKLKEAFKLKKEKLAEEKCLRVQERIQNKEGNLEQVKEKHMSVYANMTERVQKFIDRFKAAGLNTSKVEADLVTLQSKIEEFKIAYANYSAKFRETKTAACGDTEGGLRGKLVDARAELKITHDIAADIREYMRTVILVDLKELKAQMPQDEKAETEEKTKTENDDEVKTESTGTDASATVN